MNTLYDLITILPFSLLMLILLGGYAGIPETGAPGYAVCAAVAVFFILLRNMQRKNRLRSIGIVAVFLAGLALAAGKEYRQLFFTDYFWVIRTGILSAASVAAGFLMNRDLRVRRAAAAALLICCIVGAVSARSIGKEAFALICFILLVRLAEEVQRKWKKSGCPEMKGHITRISPFFLAGCLLVYAVPAPEKPYDWQIVKDACHRAADFAVRVYGRMTHPSDDYAKSGFSDRGGFAAGLSENSAEVLIIRADDASVRNYKLTGCIGSGFNGREWVFDSENACKSRMLDTMETVSAVRQFAPDSRPDYLRKVDLYYDNRFFNTRYIFSPAKIKLKATQEKNDVIEQNGSIVSEKRLQYKDKYFVSCFSLNYGNPHFPELLNSAAPVSEDAWKQTAGAENVLYQSGYSYADYQKYRREIYDSIRPAGLSEAVKAILSDISGQAENRYEAMKLLESYLGSMEYSADCGALPDSVTDAGSFLDYFLFTAQKGYCMHYATAFVLMANEMGIPCRYVQGYSVSADGKGNISVKQDCAHAWPEVYFDHVGWIAFEPTPGYSVDGGWTVREPGSFGYGQERPHYGPGSILPAQTDLPADTEPESAGINPLVFMIPSLAVLCFLLLFYLISRAVSRRKYAQMPCGTKFRYLAQQNLRLLGYLGFRLEPGETLTEYLERIQKSDRQDLKAHLGFIPLYEAVLYSDREITEAEIRSAEQIRQAIRTLVGRSRLRYRLMLLFRN